MLSRGGLAGAPEIVSAPAQGRPAAVAPHAAGAVSAIADDDSEPRENRHAETTFLSTRDPCARRHRRRAGPGCRARARARRWIAARRSVAGVARRSDAAANHRADQPPRDRARADLRRAQDRARRYRSARPGAGARDHRRAQGRPVWFHAVPAAIRPTDFRVQRYRGQPVLTWWQGAEPHRRRPRRGRRLHRRQLATDVIATVNAGNGLDADTTSSALTPEGTALITIYHAVPYDLSAVGGPADGTVFDGDRAGDRRRDRPRRSSSGTASTTCRSTRATRRSRPPRPRRTTTSTSTPSTSTRTATCSIDARNTWAIYKVDRRSGRIIWRLGGKRERLRARRRACSSPGSTTPPAADATRCALFDNEAAPAVLPHSRVIWLRRDQRNHTATLVRSFEHPDGLSRRLAGRRAGAARTATPFVGWGQLGRVLRVRPVGNLLFDATAAGLRHLPRLPLRLGRRSPTARRRRPRRATPTARRPSTRSGTARPRWRAGASLGGRTPTTCAAWRPRAGMGSTPRSP